MGHRIWVRIVSSASTPGRGPAFAPPPRRRSAWGPVYRDAHGGPDPALPSGLRPGSPREAGTPGSDGTAGLLARASHGRSPAWAPTRQARVVRRCPRRPGAPWRTRCPCPLACPWRARCPGESGPGHPRPTLSGRPGALRRSSSPPPAPVGWACSQSRLPAPPPQSARRRWRCPGSWASCPRARAPHPSPTGSCLALVTPRRDPAPLGRVSARRSGPRSRRSGLTGRIITMSRRAAATVAGLSHGNPSGIPIFPRRLGLAAARPVGAPATCRRPPLGRGDASRGARCRRSPSSPFPPPAVRPPADRGSVVRPSPTPRDRHDGVAADADLDALADGFMRCRPTSLRRGAPPWSLRLARAGTRSSPRSGWCLRKPTVTAYWPTRSCARLPDVVAGVIAVGPAMRTATIRRRCGAARPRQTPPRCSGEVVGRARAVAEEHERRSPRRTSGSRARRSLPRRRRQAAAAPLTGRLVGPARGRGTRVRPRAVPPERPAGAPETLLPQRRSRPASPDAPPPE